MKFMKKWKNVKNAPLSPNSNYEKTGLVTTSF